MATRKRTRDRVPAAVSKAIDGFKKWRQAGRPGGRIPDRLWRAAVKAAEAYRPHRTSRLLGLEYSALKKRMSGGALRAGGKRRRRARFVEVAASAALLAPECVAVITDPSGTTLRLELRGLDAAQLGALARSFAQGAEQ